MGNTSSTENIIQNSTNLSLTQTFTTNNILVDNENANNNQVITLSITDADGCPIDTTQSIVNSLTVSNKIDNTATQTLANQLNSSLQSTLQQNASMVNGFAAATGGNNTDAYNYVSNKVSEIISQKITLNNIETIAKTAYNSQQATLTMAYCKNSPITMNQTIVSNIISQNILNNLQTALLQDTTISNLVSFADQTASQQNQGLNDLVDSIGKAVSSILGAFEGPFQNVAIACVILCCLCCAGFVYFLMSPAGQQATSTVVNTGANIAKSKV